jgi:hypothetical protein
MGNRETAYIFNFDLDGRSEVLGFVAEEQELPKAVLDLRDHQGKPQRRRVAP